MVLTITKMTIANDTIHSAAELFSHQLNYLIHRAYWKRDVVLQTRKNTLIKRLTML